MWHLLAMNKKSLRWLLRANKSLVNECFKFAFIFPLSLPFRVSFKLLHEFILIFLSLLSSRSILCFFPFQMKVKVESGTFNGHFKLNVYLSRHMKRHIEEKHSEKVFEKIFLCSAYFLSSYIYMKWNRTYLWLYIVLLLHNISPAFNRFKSHSRWANIFASFIRRHYVNVKVFCTTAHMSLPSGDSVHSLKCKSKILARWARAKWHTRYIQIRLLMPCYSMFNPKSKCFRASGKVCVRDLHCFSFSFSPPCWIRIKANRFVIST